jgi:hypothetical protein
MGLRNSKINPKINSEELYIPLNSEQNQSFLNELKEITRISIDARNKKNQYYESILERYIIYNNEEVLKGALETLQQATREYAKNCAAGFQYKIYSNYKGNPPRAGSEYLGQRLEDFKNDYRSDDIPVNEKTLERYLLRIIQMNFEYLLRRFAESSGFIYTNKVKITNRVYAEIIRDNNNKKCVWVYIGWL